MAVLLMIQTKDKNFTVYSCQAKITNYSTVRMDTVPKLVPISV